MLQSIERATRQRIAPLSLPSTETVNNKRIADFKQRITDTLAAGELGFMQGLIEQYQEEHDIPALEIAAALAKLSIGEQPLLLEAPHERPRRERPDSPQGRRNEPRGERYREDGAAPSRPRPASAPEQGMERFRLAVGYRNGVKPGNIVGAIANEAGLDARHIGRIDIEESFSLIDLPSGMPREILQDLKRVRVCGRPLAITPLATEQGQSQGQHRQRGAARGRPDADGQPPASGPGNQGQRRAQERRTSQGATPRQPSEQDRGDDPATRSNRPEGRKPRPRDDRFRPPKKNR